MPQVDYEFDRKKVIDKAKYFTEKTSMEEMTYEFIYKMKVMVQRNLLEDTDDIMKEELNKMENENMINKAKLQSALPTGIITGLVINACIIAIVLTIFAFQVITNVKVIDFHILIFTAVGGCGLLHTSIATIKGWRRYVCEER